jgi:hypothetical protein
MSDIENKEEQEKEQEEELVGATDQEIAKDDKTEESED